MQAAEHIHKSPHSKTQPFAKEQHSADAAAASMQPCRTSSHSNGLNAPNRANSPLATQTKPQAAACCVPKSGQTPALSLCSKGLDASGQPNSAAVMQNKSQSETCCAPNHRRTAVQNQTLPRKGSAPKLSVWQSIVKPSKTYPVKSVYPRCGR